MAIFAGFSLTQHVLIVFAAMVAIIASALGFEHIGGYVPCALCLEQRNPYYLAIPFLAFGLVSAMLKWSVCISRSMLAIGGLALIATAAIGVYHSGVEWGIFAAPQSCGAGLTGDAGDAGNLLESLASSKPPSCADAAGRFLGISFANANVMAAGLFAIIAFNGVFGKTAD